MHIKSVHEKLKAYKCECCGKEFSQKNTLNTHLKIVHKNEKDHKCDVCEKHFSQRELKKHLKIVHFLEKLNNYRCMSCEKKFGDNTSLKRHVKTVHENQRQHDCNFCGKFFGIKSGLIMHVRRIHK